MSGTLPGGVPPFWSMSAGVAWPGLPRFPRSVLGQDNPARAPWQTLLVVPWDSPAPRQLDIPPFLVSTAAPLPQRDQTRQPLLTLAASWQC
ncbi:unnamed protein product [Parajaminaea phylloscopi]